MKKPVPMSIPQAHRTEMAAWLRERAEEHLDEASRVRRARGDVADAPRLRRQAAQTDAARVRSVFDAATRVADTGLPSLSTDARALFAASLLALNHALEIADREANAIIAANTPVQ